MNDAPEFQHINREVGMYFDQRLSKDAEENFLKKVENDPDYSEAFNREKSIRTHIRNGVKRSHVSPDFIQSIKEKIRIV